jgi:hypothetical protein
MRWAKSYSIVDHRLLHGGYFQKLSHEALALYLFLIVVGDKNGRSYYADPTIEGILHLSREALDEARSCLLHLHLIDYRKPYWWVKNLESTHERSQTKDPISERCSGALVSSDPKRVGDLAKESFQALLKNFGGKNETPVSSR